MTPPLKGSGGKRMANPLYVCVLEVCHCCVGMEGEAEDGRDMKDV